MVGKHKFTTNLGPELNHCYECGKGSEDDIHLITLVLDKEVLTKQIDKTIKKEIVKTRLVSACISVPSNYNLYNQLSESESTIVSVLPSWTSTICIKPKPKKRS